MGKDPNKPGGLSPYCKRCITEQVKRGKRQNIWLPRFERRMRAVPDVALEGDAEFLAAKLEIVVKEMRRRSKMKK